MSNGAKPYPKRWWWTRRLGIVIAALLLVTVVSWIAWHVHATAALNAQLDRIAAAGEPLEWADFKPDSVPDDENAALLYTRAKDLLPRRPDYPSIDPGATKAEILAIEKVWQQESDRIRRQESMVRPLLRHPDFRREHATDLQAILADSAQARALWREARAIPDAYWLIEGAGLFQDLFYYKLQEVYSRVLLAAVAAHDRGDDAEAAEHLLDASAFGRSVGKSPSLLFTVIAESADTLLAGALEEIAPTLHIGTGPKAATPQQIDRLIKRLLDDATYTANFRRGLMLERGRRHYFLQEFRRGAFDASSADAGIHRLMLPHWPVFAPLYKLEHARVLRDVTTAIAAYDTGCHPRARTFLPLEPPDEYRDPGLSRRLSHKLSSDFEQMIRNHFKRRAIHRMAATALAIRRSELSHGRRPATLAELVPEYIPAVPTDPFTDPAGPLVYRPKANPPVLYSIGLDGRDDGGERLEASITDVGDIPFYLDGDPRKGKADWTDPTLPFTAWIPPTGPGTATSAPASRPSPGPSPAAPPPAESQPAGAAP